ncbi:DUF1665 domain containing protein [Colletotrichum sojae]|uniref:DUF1665 domain containing protein n=1 Tax=Colletotrichum sojae TaxID=2175907 RepID=A0A8H6MI69_9PEZI|nr:DUF1665 domain containing protein [Colletotrichum sojae]
MKSRSEPARAGRTIREQAERMMARLRFPDDHFPVAMDDWTQSWPHINREQCMVAFMEEVTIEENWVAKVFDDASINAWKADVMGRETQDWQAPYNIRHGDFTETMFTCEKAKLYRSTGIVPVLDMEARLARSDTIIPPELKAAFQRAAVSIERVSAHKSDWKPTEENIFQKSVALWEYGSESQLISERLVVNLIDPYLYALINGRSRILLDKEIGLDNYLGHIAEGITVPETGILDEMFRRERHVPLLHRRATESTDSMEVRFPDGQNAKIVSYVSNLHPQDHADVYPLLEKVITKAMPLWNLVYCTIYQYTMNCDVRILCDELRRVFPGQKDDLLDIKTDMINALMEDEEQRVVKKPEPGTGKDRYRDEDSKLPPAEAVADYTTMLGSAKGIQVIVKLRAMYLTPEYPVCDLPSHTVLDGAWNDHIAATAVYFFDDDNVTDAKISFQSQVDDDFTDCFSWVDNDPGDIGLDELFGFKGGMSTLQAIGSATMREGLMLAYPNVLLHKESSFRLKDPTRPGHRKVLTLHLVDPRVRVFVGITGVIPLMRAYSNGHDLRRVSYSAHDVCPLPIISPAVPTVLSTANVPPQRTDWWAREFSNSGGQFKGMPKEVVDMVEDNVTGFPIHRDEAVRLRKERLVSDRGTKGDKVQRLMNWRRVASGRRR